MLYIKLFIEREKNTGQSAPECPFKLISTFHIIAKTVEILAKTALHFFSTERLTMELFKSKVPLIEAFSGRTR